MQHLWWYRSPRGVRHRCLVVQSISWEKWFWPIWRRKSRKI